MWSDLRNIWRLCSELVASLKNSNTPILRNSNPETFSFEFPRKFRNNSVIAPIIVFISSSDRIKSRQKCIQNTLKTRLWLPEGNLVYNPFFKLSILEASSQPLELIFFVGKSKQLERRLWRMVLDVWHKQFVSFLLLAIRTLFQRTHPARHEENSLDGAFREWWTQWWQTFDN